MDRKLKIVGLLRFSVLTPTYYSETFDTLEKTAAHLFAPERMALRFRLFERLCLPSLRRQSDKDFEAVVLTAASLPDTYLDRLRALLRPIPNIRLRTVGTDNHYRLLRRGYGSVDAGAATHRALFRLDDDDAVDRDFIARTRRLAEGLLAVQDPETPFVIAHNRGFYVRIRPGGNEVFDACERAPLSTGTTLVAPVGYPDNPYRYNHRNLAQHFNTWSDISVPGFIRTIHGDNKSSPAQMGITRKMDAAQIDTALRRHFDLSRADLQAL